MRKTINKFIGKSFLKIYKHRKQKAFNPSLEHCLATTRSMLKQSKYCFLISHSERQAPSARMVQPIIDFDTLDVWLGTNPTLRKAKEIEQNPYVTLAFGNDKEDANLIIYGKAHIVQNMLERKKHWINSWFLFFPGGPTSDDFVSIRVEPFEMELMNFAKNLVPEPFGLKPVKIIKEQDQWQVRY